jgi:hypothetical protein
VIPRLALLGALLALALPGAALAHVERSSYWPDPAPDCSITPCAGGAVPKAHSLRSALNRKAVGDTRVVCQADSLERLKASIAAARKDGYFIRPTDHRSFSARAGRRLLRINRKLNRRCRFQSIQDAVTASGNNDRVVIMPGIYTEPKSRAAKTNDPACEKYRIGNDYGTMALSYAYQSHCPNDQNLIAVLGRDVGPGQDPQPPREDRHGIPNLGPCIRCNFQMEGSGVSADDVVVDAGNVDSGDHGPRDSKKDIGIRADRADGFVLRNVKVRHAREHDIYVVETDGYRLDRIKTYWGGEYGVLTFVEDHGLMQNCEAMGSGDSGLYPGAGAEAGAQRRPGEPFRYTQRITHCDSHHNAGGYSGTDGNSTHVDHNNFYDNALGFTTDVFTASGHPGFPQDSDLIEYNNFYDNNYNPYGDRGPKEDIEPSIPVPVGTGLWIAGGNDNVVRYNRFYDNWRRGTMLFAVPDSTVCGPAPIGQPVTGCDATKFSTSFRNQFYGNIMGVSPTGQVLPNGADFWWDNFATNTGNCWWDNQAAPGAQLHNQPASLPDCDGGKNPGSSMGTADFGNEAELVSCFGAISSGNYQQPCPWFDTPPKPGTKRAARLDARRTARTRAFVAQPEVKSQLCRVYRDRPLACAGL